MERKIGGWGFVVIWEFQVRPGMENRFEQVCGLDGVWAKFFRQDEAYIGTELIRDLKTKRSYLTLDFWNVARGVRSLSCAACRSVQSHRCGVRKYDGKRA